MNKALKSLISIGRAEKDIEIYGRVFHIHTLDMHEQLLATNSTSEYDNLSRILAMRIAILSYAVDSIDGEDLGNNSEIREIFSQLQVPLINKIYNEYEKLADQQAEDLRKLEQNNNLAEASSPSPKVDAIIADDDEDTPNKAI